MSNLKKYTPLTSEWVALVVGCSVGFFWWILHRLYFVQLYWVLIPSFKGLAFLPTKFDFLYAVINLSVALAQGLTVGFVTGCLSRRHPFLLSLVAMLLTFALKIFHDTLDLWHNPRPPYESWWVAVLLAIIYILTPLCGAYIAGRLLCKGAIKTNNKIPKIERLHSGVDL